jgi:hypothetical protein
VSIIARFVALFVGAGLALACSDDAMAFNDSTVTANPGGIAAGGDIRNNTIHQTIIQQDPAALAAMVKVLTDRNAATTEARVRAEREAAALAEKLKLTTEAFTGLLQTLGNVPSNKIPAKLIEIATQQVATGQHLALFDPSDAATKALVNQAKVALDKGHPAAASALLLRAGSDLDISNVRIARSSYGLSVITGMATNQSGRTLSHAFVKFNLYDDRGTVAGNVLDHASDLAPSDRWAFKAETGTKFAIVKLTGVQVFPPAP